MCGPRALLLVGIALAVGAGEPARAQQNPYDPNGLPNPYAPNGLEKKRFDGPFDPPPRPVAPRPARPDIELADKLNTVLAELRPKQAALPARDVPLDEKVLRALNVTRGKRGSELAVMRRAGTIKVPEALRGEKTDMDCRRAAGLLQEGVRQVKAGKLRPDLPGDIRKATDQLNAHLVAMVNEVPVNQYLEAKRLLMQMGEAAKALEDPGVAKDLIAAEELPTKCKTAAALVRYMTENGLRFAPAQWDDVPAYEEAARALGEYARDARPRDKGK
jgi:hypothetical protein